MLPSWLTNQKVANAATILGFALVVYHIVMRRGK